MEYSIGKKVFEDWEIIEKIGEGSYGKVFKLRKEEFGVTVQAALKVIRIPRSEDDVREAYMEGMDERSVTSHFEEVVAHFMKEIKIMSELKSHPNIVACENFKVIPHEGKKIGWDILIQMELLNPLKNYLYRHPMNEEMVRSLAIDICDALVFCQKKNLIHRDIKPENIFVDEQGHFKLGDFGVARNMEKTMGNFSKQGTENYMAPEVFKGFAYDASVDIYSLGLVLYRLMNGNRLPFLPLAPAPIQFSDREAALNKRIGGAVMPPPCNASEEFAEIILKACASDPKDRYHTATEMLDDLKGKKADTFTEPSGEMNFADDEDEEDETIGGFWGAINTEEDEKEPASDPEPVADDEEKNETIGMDFSKFKKPEEAPEEKKEPEKKKAKKVPKKKPVGLMVAAVAVVTVVGVIVGVMSGGNSGSSSSTTGSTEMAETTTVAADEPICIGLLNSVEEVMPYGTDHGVEYAHSIRPSVVIDGKEYQVELVESGCIAGYEMISSGLMDAIDLFEENNCTAVINGGYLYDSALFTKAAVKNQWTFLTDDNKLSEPELIDPETNIFVDYDYRQCYPVPSDTYFYALSDWMINEESGSEAPTLLILYDGTDDDEEAYYTDIYKGEDGTEGPLEWMTEAFEYYGGTVVTVDVQNGTDSYSDIVSVFQNSPCEFIMCLSNYDKENAVLNSDFTDAASNIVEFVDMNYEMLTGLTGLPIHVFSITDLYNANYACSYHWTTSPAENGEEDGKDSFIINFQSYLENADETTLNEAASMDINISDVVNEYSYVDDAIHGYTCYNVILDALETGMDINEALQTTSFYNDIVGEFEYEEDGHILYKSLRIINQGKSTEFTSSGTK